VDLDRYTVKSREALERLQRVARDRSHQELRPEHLLAALLDERDGTVSAVLQKLGVNAASLAQAVEPSLESLPRVQGGQAYLGMGDPYLFTSIAAVAIGGASILGGSGHYVGTIAGAFVLTILAGLLPALDLSNGALLIVYGAVILTTVSLASEAFSDLAATIHAMLRPNSIRSEPS